MLTTGSVAWLTISVPRKKYVAQAIHCFARVGLRNKAKKSGASTGDRDRAKGHRHNHVRTILLLYSLLAWYAYW